MISGTMRIAKSELYFITFELSIMNQNKPSLKNFFVALSVGIAVVIVGMTVSFKHHQQIKDTKWKTEIWADQAGYYVYLPCWFDYGFQSKNFPANSDHDLGDGFRLDHPSGIIQNKYTAGPAMLITPFYLGNKLAGSIFSYEHEPFSESSYYVVDTAASFYCGCAAMLLILFLTAHVRLTAAIITTLCIIYATNVYYYTTTWGGFSHIYSFFLFSAFLYLSQKILTFFTWKFFILFSIVCSLIVISRMTDALFLFSFFFLAPSFKSLLSFFTFRRIISFVSIAMLVALPQLIYWKVFSGHFFYYSYQGEGFDRLSSPWIYEFLFSPRCGLITYNPSYLIMLFAVFFALTRKNKYSWFILFLNVFMIYLYSSWWSICFGCSFGSRNFVELFAGLALPTALLINDVMSRSWFTITFTGVCLAFCLVFQVRISSDFENFYCYTDDTWDWKEYFSLTIRERTIINQDFESSVSQNPNIRYAWVNSPAMNSSGAAFTDSTTGSVTAVVLSGDSLPYRIKFLELHCNIYSDEDTVEGETGYQVYYENSLIKEEFSPFKLGVGKKSWQKIDGWFVFIKPPPRGAKIYILYRNKTKRKYYIDNFVVEMH
jgi:hypothetical protein